MVRYHYAYYSSSGIVYFRFIFQRERDLWIHTWQRGNVRIYPFANTKEEILLNKTYKAKNIIEYEGELERLFRLHLKEIEAGKFKEIEDFLSEVMHYD